MTPEAKTIPILSKQRNMSRPPVPMQAQALTGTSATGREATPPEAQAMPRVRNMIRPSEQPAGVAAKTAAVLIPVPGEAPTFAPLKQCNLARPLPPPALAPTTNKQGGAPIEATAAVGARESPAVPKRRNLTRPAGVTAAVLMPAPGETQTSVPLKQRNLTRPDAPAPTMNQQTGAPIDLPTVQRNMSWPPHPAAQGATDAMPNKQRNMTRPPLPGPDPTPRNMTRPTLPVPEASSSHSGAPLLIPQLDNFEYIWADPDSVRQQCEEFPRNKDGHGVKHRQEWLKSALNLLSRCRDPQQVLELLCCQKHEELYRLEMHLRGLELAELELQDARKSIRAAVPKGEGQDDN
ncbi:uncharacterized protein LACBIDRAFT_317245 [Laccaria bicolor S238N-H82]|uniref:Predicted protein n=1 Tax=Laccaria bicolor (strain S238N-H82 / ATCC MYA-4686) TaxID=486041 RepID=B0D4R4_LACBS|nr:uncharacterized protein LACBIDRAFT_317245 [Laccaria bicolor S238N-H82]EDR10390.1 predicted protein [Laccaria bicolor S238N-H82]|eukprot:XP_001878840.1 predicted protein [Laccaria bicolor S238N-H82]